MENTYRNIRKLKAAIGGLAILAGIIGCLEIADRNIPCEIPIYTAAKRYIGAKSTDIYLKVTGRSTDVVPRTGFP